MCSNHDDEVGIAGSFWDPTGLGFLCYDSVLAGPVTSHKDSSYVPTSPRSTDVREFYLGLTEVGKRKSYKDVKHYKRRKRWLS